MHTPGYEKTAQALAKLVKAAGIGDVFIQDVNEFHGCDHNVQLLPDGTTRTHLYVTIPNNFKFMVLTLLLVTEEMLEPGYLNAPSARQLKLLLSL